MTLYSLFDLVSFIAGKFAQGSSLSPGRFNLLLPECQDEFFAKCVDQKDWDALRNFRKTIGDDTLGVITANGMAELPSDYCAGGEGYFMYGDEPVRINFMTDTEYDRFISHKIETPTVKFPIANIQGGSIRFRPKTINYIVFTYLTKPAVPVFDWCYPVDNPTQIVYMAPGSFFIESNTPGRYNLRLGTTIIATDVLKDDVTMDGYVSATTELSWPENYHYKFVWLVLAKCGINLSEKDVAMYALQMEQK